MTILFVALLAVVPTTLAFQLPHIHIPNPFDGGGGGGNNGKPQFCPIIEKHEDIQGAPWQVGVSVPGGGTLEAQETHEIGTTWEQGQELSIGLSYIITAAAAISVSVADTVTDSLAETGSVSCPAGLWHCSLLIYPALTRISGFLKKLGPGEKCAGGQFGSDTIQDGAAWIVVMPRKDAAGNGVWGLELCTCGNLAHANDKGHPALSCTDHCATTGGGQ